MRAHTQIYNHVADCCWPTHFGVTVLHLGYENVRASVGILQKSKLSAKLVQQNRVTFIFLGPSSSVAFVVLAVVHPLSI